ncbi:hypothetical protein ACIBFB_12700 [Nocardiopsis sp. NPDC050513]|uniref:hypothetical protein n=1 Tax=Nocardiopsis sp. NPDC050513 TaxID=3364338 RepID=UPI00378ADD92
MSARSAEAALAPPGPHGWDFSDYPFGLEPMTLPHPGATVTPEPGSLPEDVLDAHRSLSVQHEAGFEPTAPAGDDLERLFWFRWMIGHHVSFALWRLLADALARVSPGSPDGDDQRELARAITQYVRAYCGMLLYTGSSTRQVYNAVIRPSMYRLHSTFSGTWAPDYPAVRSLFRGRRTPPVHGAEIGALEREVRLSNLIHLGVSSKLVVDGRSLLQHSIDTPDTHQPRMWGAIFDCYFLTLRAPVTPDRVVAQLLRRVKAIAIDVATNGLYPGAAHSAEESPEELARPEVLACERELTATLVGVAGLAAGLVPEPGGAPTVPCAAHASPDPHSLGGPGGPDIPNVPEGG